MATEARYRGHCPTCPWTGRPLASYGEAEKAAQAHAQEKKHRTHVLDHYSLRVTGSGFDQTGNPARMSGGDTT